MTHKEALDILLAMLKEKNLSEEEKEAVRTAVGVLSFTYLAEKKIGRKNKKREL